MAERISGAGPRRPSAGPRTARAAGRVAALAAAALTVGIAGPRAVDAASPAAGSQRGSGPVAGTDAVRLAGRPGGLSAMQLAGERVIYSYRGLEPPRSLIARIRAGEAAGVIFFSGNIASRAQIRRVAGELRRAAQRSPVKLPLLLMTDQEGGEVRRLPGAPALSEKQIGASSRPSVQAARAGRDAGLNLRDAGIDVNLAPVLGVYRGAGDILDRYGRSYGDNPRTVAGLGAGFIRAQQRTGVAATAKHFPGLGAAAAGQDTDRRPVTLRVSLADLRSIDERPYRSAIAAGVRLVMVSWARYPVLDRRLPAGLSATVVQGELRRRLGFRGVTITDALGAGALRAYGGTRRRAVLAARAGMDLLLCAGQSVSEGTAAVHALAGALHRHVLGRTSFEESAGRVIALRGSLRG